MKPLKLSIEGVFSYQKKQTIDFARLSAGGIFGIFGNTGSGKSSIIEAMLFALYGRSDRISGRQVDLINLRSDKATIEFEFEAFDKQYLSVVNLKRTKAKHDTKRFLYVLEEGNYRAVSEQCSIEEIIGLSYENFCRIVIIPQGKFQAFFSLTEKERTQMLKEIFPLLGRYDLKKALDTLTARTKEALNIVLGKLSQLQEYTKENLEEKKESFREVKAKYEQINECNNSLKKAVQDAKTLLQIFENKVKTFQEREKLSSQTEEIAQLEKRLNEYLLAVNKFKALLSSFENLTLQISHIEQKEKENSDKLSQTKQQLDNLKQQFELLQKENEKTPQQQQEIGQIIAIIELQTIEKQLLELKSKLQKEQSSKSKGEALLQDKEKERQALGNKIAQSEALRINPAEFSAVRQWYWEKDVLDKGIQKIKSTIEDLDKQRTDLQRQMQISESENPILYLEKAITELQEEIRRKEIERSNYQLTQALSRYSESLTDNEPCPLCGSLSHPRIASSENVDKYLKNIDCDIKNLKDRESTFNTYIVTFNSLAKWKKEQEQELIALKGNVQLLENKFIWDKYRNKSLQEIKQIEAEDTQLQLQITQLYNKRNEIETTIRRYSDRLNEISSQLNLWGAELAKQEGRAEQLSVGIEANLKEKYSQSSANQLKEECERLSSEIEKRSSTLSQLLSNIERHNSEKISLETNAIHYKEQLQKHKGELTELERLLDKALLESKFESLQKVRELLDMDLDTETLQGRINDFKTQSEVLNIRFKDLCEQTEGKICPEKEKIQQDEELVKRNELQIKEILEEKGRIEGLIKTMTDKLEQKQGLEKDNKALETRLHGLGELSTMFKGEKFVQFISTVYLEQLCAKANERLRIITRNKFELRYTDRNFEVVDWLNEGRTRSIKTLSGGQMFQASLCMALALVDTIRLNANTNQDFFFIDEGFGTQDTESLDLIFTSLKALRQEDKTVGLISHNELLKEKIASNITVSIDQNKGYSVCIHN